MTQHKSPKPPNFNALTLNQGIDQLIQDAIYRQFHIAKQKVRKFLLDRKQQFGFHHGFTP